MDMRGVRQTAFVLVFVLNGSLFAAAKDNPAPAWAVDASKIATPDYAKDSSAVILTDQTQITVDAQNHAVERELQAVRILTARGRDWGQMDVTYDLDRKLEYFRCWTITKDGRQFEAKESDFVDRGAYAGTVLQLTERYRELNPPAGDPGNVVACESEVHLRPYISEKLWQVQSSIPAVSQSLDLILPLGARFVSNWHRLKAEQPTELPGNHLRWEVKDVPALDLKTISLSPSFVALAGRVSIHWGETAIKDPKAQWQQIGLWREKLNENRAVPTSEITAKVQALVAGAPDLYGKMNRIAEYIQKNVQYFIVMKGIGGQQAHFASDIFRVNYGDCKDKTTLLMAMLQTIGIKSHYFTVDSRRGFIDLEAPSVFGNHMVTAIELPAETSDPRLSARVKGPNGVEYLIFDPTDEETPMGLLGADLQGAYGYISDGANSQILQMPKLAPEMAIVQRKGSFSLQPDGAMQGDVAATFTGDPAGIWRYRLKHTEADKVRDRLERMLGAEISALTFKTYEFRQVGDQDKPLELDLHFSAANYLHPSGGLLLFRPRVYGSDTLAVSDVMAGKERLYPIVIGHPGHWIDQYDFILPDGYSVDEVADPVKLDLDFASYRSKVDVKGQTLHYEREYVVREVELPPDRAADLRRLENLILADEKAVAVLKKQ